jgi:cytochrome c-type biogenesis protein CcmH
MSIFWTVAALFLLGALLMLLPSLLQARAAATTAATTAAGTNLAVHRDQLREAEADLAAGLITPERFAQARSEIVQRVIEDTAPAEAPAGPTNSRRTALVLAVLIPVASVLTYLQLGNPEAAAPGAATAPADRHSVTPEQIQKMVAALGERLKAQPDDAEGWLMLGRSYTALSRYRDAATALRRAMALLPGNPHVLTDLADVLAMANNKRLAGEPARLVQQALDLDPKHIKALALAGSVSFEAKDYAAARGYWQRLLAVVPAESPMARSVQGSIAEATQLQTGDAPKPPAAGEAITGQVVLSPALASRLAAGDTVFIFARAAEGPRMPLAILRQPATAQALAFRLDDSLAMSPQFKLSGFASVVVGARISRSGNATPQPGDLLGQSAPVPPGTQGLQIVIDRVQP